MKETRSVVAMLSGAVTAFLFAAASTGFAQPLPRLPADLVFHAAEGSPGKVTFVHRSHVDDKRPECTTCHPALFRILKTSLQAGAPRISHSSMEAGRQCGACHNDKWAFGLDRCELCHRAE